MLLRARQLIAAASLAALGSVARAQEFTTQTLLVAPLDASTSVRVARQVERRTRSRLARAVNRREVRIVGSDTVEASLRYAGYRDDVRLGESEARVLSRLLRADEVVVGTLHGRVGAIVLQAEVAVPRDWRLRQPLPVIRAATATAAADTLAAYVARARSQMIGLRRCENALRSGDNERAAKSAEEAVRLYAPSTLARTCLAVALRTSGSEPDSVIRLADMVLSIDSTNIVMAVVRARSLSDLKSQLAAEAWERVVRLRPDSLDLAIAGVEELLRLEQPARALGAVQQIAAVHKEEMRVRRLTFRTYVALSQWKNAAQLGDSLDYQDVAFRSDSMYAVRHIEALRLSGDTLSALSKSARSVKEFPGDLSIYLQYVQLIKSEDSSAFPRGLTLFPGSSELHVLAAREAVAAGKRRDALASLGAAVQSDTTLTQGYLQIADLWFNEQEPDSAVAAVTRAPRGGARAELLRTYAMARGRQMIRGVPDTAFAVWHRAIALFSVADSVDSRDDTRGLIAASNLQIARGSLVAASKARDCPNASRATDALGVTAAMLERGVGEGGMADQIREAYDQMRPIADSALKIYCNGTTPPPPNE
jgi:tetratricopeptide (TPR) repeat protein